MFAIHCKKNIEIFKFNVKIFLMNCANKVYRQSINTDFEEQQIHVNVNSNIKLLILKKLKIAAYL